MKFFTLLLFTSLLHAASFHYLIPKEKLEDEFYKKFPIEKKTLFATIVLSEPKISLQNSNFILNTTITLPRILDDEYKALSTKVKLKSKINFVAPTSLFLQDIEILDIENSYLDEKKKELLQLSLTLALNAYFQSHIIYKINYDDIDSKLAKMAASHLQKIKIKDEGIDLQFEF